MDTNLLKIIQEINEILLHDRIVVTIWTEYNPYIDNRYYHFIFKIPNKNYDGKFTINEKQFKDKDIDLMISGILEKVRKKLYDK